MVTFTNYNANLKNKKTTDCVVRALSKASYKDYKDVAKDLFNIWMKTGYMPNDKKCYEKWLKANGFIKYKQPRREDNTKYLVGEIDELVSYGDRVIISCAGHLTFYEDNKIWDIWDCRKKSIGNYWIKE